MNKKLLILFVALTATVATGLAQSRGALRINEIMVENIDNCVDDYGQHSAWIELFNSSFAPLDIASVYISNDPANPKLYPVPLNDVKTRIPKRQQVVFWADGQNNRGTFHTNFVIQPGDTIYLFDANGKTPIDKVAIPADLPANASYARMVDDKGNVSWQICDGTTESKYITPGRANQNKAGNERVARFQANDENGFALTIMAMGIVFSALLLLVICFYIISKIGAYKAKDNKAKAHSGTSVSKLAKDQRPDHDSGEEIAAIAMALHEHLNAHDTESAVLTINKVKRAYSPWSSKIYGLREVPRR